MSFLLGQSTGVNTVLVYSAIDQGNLMHVVIDNGNVTPLASPDRWTPVLNGKTFCSPACGFKCTKAAFDAATDGARSLVNQLGSGWEPRVWENLGWHFEATRRGATVAVNDDGKYKAAIRFHMEPRTELCVSETRDTAREAVEAVVENLNGRVAILRRALLSLSLAPLEIQDV